jgi:hypothetical protein
LRPAGQTHERIGSWKAAGGEREPPREEEAHEGRGPRSVLNNPAEDADACRDRGPEVEPVARSAAPRRFPDVTGTCFRCAERSGAGVDEPGDWRTTRGQGPPRGRSCSAGGDRTLKGRTPWAGPARNKAGRCRAEKGLESVRNAEEARTRRLVTSGVSGCPASTRRRRGTNRKGGSCW